MTQIEELKRRIEETQRVRDDALMALPIAAVAGYLFALLFCS